MNATLGVYCDVNKGGIVQTQAGVTEIYAVSSCAGLR